MTKDELRKEAEAIAQSLYDQGMHCGYSPDGDAIVALAERWAERKVAEEKAVESFVAAHLEIADATKQLRCDLVRGMKQRFLERRLESVTGELAVLKHMVRELAAANQEWLDENGPFANDMMISSRMIEAIADCAELVAEPKERK